MTTQQPKYKERLPRGLIEENDPRVCRFGHPAPPWLVNYADLMTEMVCFFVILYALTAVLSRNIQQAKRDIERIIKEEQLKADVKMTKEGIRLTLEEKGADAFFGVGKADLTPKMIYIMTKFGPLIKKVPNEVLIEGHTDNFPINTEQYPSNWELSSGRAHSVLHHLIDEYGIEPERISAIGYGEFRPRVPNDTPENRARNRRVVFFIKNVPPKFYEEEERKHERSTQPYFLLPGSAKKPSDQEGAFGPASGAPASTASGSSVPVKAIDEVKADLNKTFSPKLSTPPSIPSVTSSTPSYKGTDKD